MSSTGQNRDSIFTLDNLKALLEDADAYERSANSSSSNPAVSSAIAEAYRRHGLISPIKGLWQRSIPESLYRTPLSESTTTLVSWKSLPQAVKELYDCPKDCDVIEVDINHLLSDQVWREEGNTGKNHSASHGMQQRGLKGNMTNKLTEYTRGVTGRANPFTPGGLEGEEGTSLISLEQDPSLTPQAIERSMKVLLYGSESAMKDGTLLTAPHGASFKVGISTNDPLPTDEAQLQTISDHAHDNFGYFATRSEEQVAGGEAPLPWSTSSAPAIQWDERMLEDDSLFGSSVNSESDQSSLQTDSDTSSVRESGKISHVDEIPDDVQAKGDHLVPSDLAVEDSVDAEVDNLLMEMKEVDAQTKFSIHKKKKNADAHENNETIGNPLRLAATQARIQSMSSKKKSWASTKLLPIQDFSTFVTNPALKFPFTLDSFQQQAIARLERSESVFVAAHTSAGKTVVAEYAVALARQRGTRCIYTSPIKALSNQKFRDFSLKFGSENVGLVTGDLQVNVDDSTCLIMTTEILRSMLYRGADLIRDIEFVVFDEVHYVNDSERGVVWEETIILLPGYVNLIFLSATTPNTFEFSDWIGRTKKKPVYVVRTDYRPVPLSHYLWADLKLHKIKEGDSGFLEKGFQTANKALDKSSQKDSDGKKKAGQSTASARGAPSMVWQAQGGRSQWMSLIRFLCREELTPTVIFTFSKKKCEEVANMLRSLDLNTAKERGSVRAFAAQTVSRLSPMDGALPQVKSVCEMVERGIGVHHGGLLPILKEMVEILFSRNLIKVLFATETFAMGVNMPARSVVFNSIRKHDGKQFRVLEPGEYTQMAGRAGRRGLDRVGTVILCCFGEKPPPVGILRTMLTGSSTLLKSQFRLTYNMILNLLRVEEMSVESMIKRSFSEFATQRALTANEYPKLLARGERTLEKLAEQFDAEANQRLGAGDLEPYFQTCERLLMLNFEVLRSIQTSTGGDDGLFQPGRILLVTAARKLGVSHAPGMVLAYHPGGEGATFGKDKKGLPSVVCMILLPQSYVGNNVDMTDRSDDNLKECNTGDIGMSKGRNYSVAKVELNQILLVTPKTEKIDPLPSSLFESEKSSFDSTTMHNHMAHDPFAGKTSSSRKKGEDSLAFFGKKADRKARANNGISKVGDIISALIQTEQQELSDGVETLNLSDFLKSGQEALDLRERTAMIGDLVSDMRKFESHHHPTLEKHFAMLERLRTLQSHVKSLSHMLSNESLLLFPDFLQRKNVLRVLGYLDENEAVTVKGRVACEVNTCEEVIVTEMVFEGVLNDLEPPVIVAALSSLVYQEKGGDEEFSAEVPDSLQTCCNKMKLIAMNLGQLQKEQGLDVDPLEYAESSISFGLVHVVYEWAIGVPFSAITQLTTVQEGSIVRCITRLDELCREVRNCARVVGNPTLYQKMEVASAAIKRDIVFAASLYVS